MPLYRPKTKCTRVGDLFRKTNASVDVITPTPAALKQHVLRANFQTLTWDQCIHSTTTALNSNDFGYENGAPIMTTLPPAPEEVLDLTRCGCHGACNTGRCSCFRQTVKCSEVCGCEDTCQNSELDDDAVYDDDCDID
jgi:hypothetical protein